MATLYFTVEPEDIDYEIEILEDPHTPEDHAAENYGYTDELFNNPNVAQELRDKIAQDFWNDVETRRATFKYPWNLVRITGTWKGLQAQYEVHHVGMEHSINDFLYDHYRNEDSYLYKEAKETIARDLSTQVQENINFIMLDNENAIYWNEITF